MLSFYADKSHQKELDYTNDSHGSPSHTGVNMLLEVGVLGGQIGEVWGRVFVSVAWMHGLVQRHAS